MVKTCLDKRYRLNFSEVEGEAEQKGFREQTFLHITILSEKVFVPLLNKFPKFEHRKVMEKIENLIKKTDWSFTPKEIYFVEEKLPESKKEFPGEFRQSYT